MNNEFEVVAEIPDIPNWGKLQGDTLLEKYLYVLKLQEDIIHNKNKNS